MRFETSVFPNLKASNFLNSTEIIHYSMNHPESPNNENSEFFMLENSG